MHLLSNALTNVAGYAQNYLFKLATWYAEHNNNNNNNNNDNNNNNNNNNYYRTYREKRNKITIFFRAPYMVLVVGRISTVTPLSYQQKGMAAKLDRSALFYSRGVRK